MATFVGLGPAQCALLVVALCSLLLLVETALGHFRSGFALRVQYAPLASEALLVGASLAAAWAPRADGAAALARIAGAVAAGAGVVGAVYHHRFGVGRRPPGRGWLLHHLMYGPPPLAPLALTLLGATAWAAASALGSTPGGAHVAQGRVLLALAALGLAGGSAQTAILHYRGAFNTPLMYAPLVVVPLAAGAAAAAAAAPALLPPVLAGALLALAVLTGVIGLGMHLRGLDRQMGGLHVFLFNVLQGPPPFAPAQLAGFAGLGLIGLWLAG